MKSFSKIASVLVAGWMLVACSQPGVERPYVSDSLLLGNVKMAVLPFDNLTEDPGAGKTMENLVMVEFLKNSSVPILDPGQVMDGLLAERIRLATSIPLETLQKLGERLGVDLFLLGVVHEYTMQRVSGSGGSGEVPLVSITLRVLSARTGDIVWATSSTRRGNDRETVFGVGRVDSIEQLAQSTAKELATEFASSTRSNR